MIVEGISGQTMVSLTRAQVSSDLQGEVVILNFESGMYYGLDDVGSYVWHLLSEPRSFNELRDAILAEYDVDSERCEADLMELLQSLAGAGLIELRDGSRL